MKLKTNSLINAMVLGSFCTLSAQKPNVVFVLTDDQGWADIACHGNPHVAPPTLDKLAQESVELTNFYVSPLCSPTRASLMSGRYSYRTNVVSTGQGLSSMKPEIITWAERLKAEGYVNGLFGKWHLGDVYPHRAQDQGFDEVLTFINGNLQAYPALNTYLNPVLIHNGLEKEYSGYCTDIFTSQAIEFIKENKEKPFFIYLATNTPHSPLQITEQYLNKYKAKGLKDQTARVYAMIENIDDNVHRLEQFLESEGLAENTIFIFMNDNGPTSLDDDRYLAQYRGKKSYVYEGGIKAMCFIKCPTKFKGSRKLDNILAHIDVLPTILDLCEIPYNSADFDGVSFAPLLTNKSVEQTNRYLFWQSHNDMPQLGRAFAVRQDSFKLVQQNNIGGSFNPMQDTNYELFNVVADPYEKNNLAKSNPAKERELLSAYQEWFNNVTSGFNELPYRIIIDAEVQDPYILTRRDWLGTSGIQDNEVGYWNVDVKNDTEYTLEVSTRLLMSENAIVVVECDNISWQINISKGQRANTIANITIPAGKHTITGRVFIGDELFGGVHFLKLSKVNSQ